MSHIERIWTGLHRKYVKIVKLISKRLSRQNPFLTLIKIYFYNFTLEIQLFFPGVCDHSERLSESEQEWHPTCQDTCSPSLYDF